MCVNFKGYWKKAKKDIIAYKVVRQDSDGLLVSEFSPPQRSPQKTGVNGAIAYYELEVKIEDDGEFGFFCYRSKPEEERPAIAVLKVLIPKGTRYRTGYKSEHGFPRTINAMAIIPFEIVKDICKRSDWNG